MYDLSEYAHLRFMQQSRENDKMSNASPLFSILIPTRNRAYLLRYALQSALDQTFDDYEIIVSDNFSDDDTEEAVRELADGKVRYFRTDRILTMPDNWEFALSKARGEWVTVLTDRFVISRELLSRAVQVMEETQTSVICWPQIAYYHNTYHQNPKLMNHLLVYPFTGRISEIDSKVALAKLFTLRYDFTSLPFTHTSVYNRKLINQIKAKAGRFFLPPAPDYTSCAALLGVSEKYVYIDRLLTISGIGKDTASSVYPTRGNNRVNFVLDFRREGQPIFKYTPLRADVGFGSTNIIVESLLRIKREVLPEQLSLFQVDWVRYFNLCYDDITSFCDDEITSLLGQGFDLRKAQKEFWDVLRKYPSRIRLAVKMHVLHRSLGSLYIQNVVKEIIRRSSLLTAVYCRIRNFQWKRPIRYIRGEDVGFSDILGAVRWLDVNWRPVDC